MINWSVTVFIFFFSYYISAEIVIIYINEFHENEWRLMVFDEWLIGKIIFSGHDVQFI
jgi:hypothetical protein